MDEIKELHSITLEIHETLEQNITTSNREAVIQIINDLLEQRDIKIQQVAPPFTQQEQSVGKEIIEYNEHIIKQMDSLFGSIKSDLQQIKKMKASNRSYINPYGNIQSTDGMFLDRKQ